MEGGRVTYLRYKPNTNCIVSYQFDRRNPATCELEPAFYYGKCSDPGGFRTANNKFQTHKWIQPSVGPAVVPFEEGSAIFYAFPNDTELDGLGILQTPEKLRRFVGSHIRGSEDQNQRISRSSLTTELVRYKPERRAVLRTRTKLLDRNTDTRDKVRIYWKVCAEIQTQEVHRRMRFLKNNLHRSSGVRVPNPLGYDPEGRILVIGEIKGRQLTKVLESKEPGNASADAVERRSGAGPPTQPIRLKSRDPRLPRCPHDHCRNCRNGRCSFAGITRTGQPTLGETHALRTREN